MENNNNTAAWTIGVIVIIVIIGGIWWFMSGNAAGSPGATASSTSAASTQAASSTPPKVAVASATGASVAAVLAGIPDVSIASGILSQTGVLSQVSGAGPYTLFVPTNEAFGNLPSGTISGMTAAQLKRMAQYHVISGRALDIDAVSSGSVQALSKDPLNFQVNLQSGTASVGGAYVLEQYKAKNGIVYLITAVLLPPAVR